MKTTTTTTTTGKSPAFAPSPVTVHLVPTIARMLDSATHEVDYRRKWSKVNRAAGMLACFACSQKVGPTNAAQFAKGIIENEKGIADHMGQTSFHQHILNGFVVHVGRAIAEWYNWNYTGTSE